jgi:hypothetical protein
MNKEPAITVGSVGALIAAAIILARTFGVPITEDQQAALLAFVAVATPIVAGIITRQFVYAPDTVRKETNEAYVAGKTGQPKPAVAGPP